MNDAVFRNGEPVHVDSSGYFLTASAQAFGYLGGRLAERRGPDGSVELIITRSSFLKSMIGTVSVAAFFFTFTWAIGQAGSEKAQFWMTIVALALGGGILFWGFVGHFLFPLTTSGFNPLVRWDPKQQVLSFDAGRVRLAKDEIRAMSFERRGVTRYRNGEGRTWFRALWIKVDQGEYIALPMNPLTDANPRAVREFLKALPISASVK